MLSNDYRMQFAAKTSQQIMPENKKLNVTIYFVGQIELIAPHAK